jgi:hypothetical protein
VSERLTSKSTPPLSCRPNLSVATGGGSLGDRPFHFPPQSGGFSWFGPGSQDNGSTRVREPKVWIDGATPDGHIDAIEIGYGASLANKLGQLHPTPRLGRAYRYSSSSMLVSAHLPGCGPAHRLGPSPAGAVLACDEQLPHRTIPLWGSVQPADHHRIHSPPIWRCSNCGALVHPSDEQTAVAWCARCGQVTRSTRDGG